MLSVGIRSLGLRIATVALLPRNDKRVTIPGAPRENRRNNYEVKTYGRQHPAEDAR